MVSVPERSKMIVDELGGNGVFPIAAPVGWPKSEIQPSITFLDDSTEKSPSRLPAGMRATYTARKTEHKLMWKENPNFAVGVADLARRPTGTYDARAMVDEVPSFTNGGWYFGRFGHDPVVQSKVTPNGR